MNLHNLNILVANGEPRTVEKGFVANQFAAFFAMNNHTKIVQVVGALALGALHPLSVVVPMQRIVVAVVVADAVGALPVEGKQSVAQAAIADNQSVVGAQNIGCIVFFYGGCNVVLAGGFPVAQLSVHHRDATLLRGIDQDKGARSQGIQRVAHQTGVVQRGVESEETTVADVVFVVGIAAAERQHAQQRHADRTADAPHAAAFVGHHHPVLL